ncbi:MAG: HEAT repeat domain-containing protein [Acidobacteria bacterium]|nr:HEAT repeat domain-containing protein [Acidobacteriota bacterium]
MTRPTRALMLLLLLAAWPASAQDLRIVNAKIETRQSSNLAQDIRQLASGLTEPAWIAYRVPLIDGEHSMCCWGDGSGWRDGGCCATCSLEGAATSISSGNRPVPLSGPIQLEQRFFWVLIRVAERRAQKVRMFSDNCPLDAGGLRVVSFGPADAAQSVRFLDDLLHSDLATGTTQGRLGQAVGVIAMHNTPAAVDTLIRFARSDTSSSVRGQALFWLAQRAGQQAEAAITDAIRNDPETDVKKRAVFALSQLPKDRGIPLLIDVARTNQNPAVRKQAMFWLGQSKDARAIAFFEEILTRK